jgi:glutamate carboxypeptidase
MTDPIVSFLEKRLDAYLDDLQTLVGIDSGSFDKAGVDAINDWLEKRLRVLGFSVQRFAQEESGDDLLATLNGTGKGHILLLGHSDTVFPKGTAAERPMTIRGDKILGPGTCDMKAGLLAGIYAVASLRELGFDDFARISYLCVSDEEIEKRHSHDLIRRIGRQADAALTLEAARANGDIVTARKGVRWFLIEAFGCSAHAGVEPEKGCSAIVALAHHVLALNELNGFRPDVTVNVGTIRGGSVPNAVPDYAQMQVDLRAFTNEDLKAVIKAVREQLEEETVPGVRLIMSLQGPGSPIMQRTPAVAALEEMAHKAARELGFEVKGTKTGGGSDAAVVADEGTPVLDGLGPIGGLDHSPDEYIELSSIVPRTVLLAKLIMAITHRETEKWSRN